MKAPQNKETNRTNSNSIQYAPWLHRLGICALFFAALGSLNAQTSSAPKLTALAVTGQSEQGQVRWRLQGQPDEVYTIQASASLKNWTDIATVLTGTNGIATFTDPQAAGRSARFYRSVAKSPTVAAASYESGRILVKPKAGVNLSSLNLTLGVNVLRTFPAIGNLQIIKVPSGTTASALIAAYQQSGLVAYAEPDYIVHALLMPNDPGFQQGDQWDLWNYGQYSGTPGADIGATNAWNIQHDASNIIVAVVDTGVRYTHQDLAANMWHNPQENQDGYTNDLYGINLTTNGLGNGNPWDDFGHGTFVSGLIGAAGNNGLGIAGVAWHVQIMALKFLNTNGDGTIADAITCLQFAQSHGARVVNASWGAPSFNSQALHDAIASLRDAGIMFVAACGNSGADNDATPLYPASYSDLDNVIAVAATDRNDALTSWSDYGATNVDLGAPGADIYSCWNGSDSNYESGDGTSYSCALVSGAVADMEAHFPNESYLQIKQQIMANVDPLSSLQGKCISGGRLDLYKALGGTASSPTLTASFSANPTSGQAPLTVQFTDTSAGNPTSWDWNFGDGSAASAVQNPSHTFTNAGNFTVTLTVANSSNQTSSASQTITVTTNGSSSLPVITISATQPNAYASGQVPGTITFHRTGDTSQSYEVYWSFSGTATNGVDYENLPTNSPFPAGQADADLTITPIDHGPEPDKTVTVTLMSGPAYQVGSSNIATVIIHGYSTSGPVASFTANPSSGQAPLAVQFTDTSTGSPASWNWNFGDGSTSTAQNPSHTYNSAGSFTATLTVTGSSNQTSSASQTITVTNATASVSAGFTANPSSGQAPLSVQFTDQSSGPVTSWNWSFGDGSTSTAQNPSHTYNSAGSFTATLTVTGSSNQTSSASQTITVTNATASVSAGFTANPSSGQAPMTVQFTDQSSGPVTSWSWNFGDGSTSTAQNPSHTYNSAGSFTATLTVTGSSGQTSSASQTITVTNAPQPVTASFSANPSSGQAPMTVQFTDQSSGPVTSWSWNFGDGSTSTAQNPSHTYNSAGSFTATLTVTGSSGQTSSASHTITVTNAPPPPSSTVTVVASQPLATSLTPGIFSLTRSGSTSSALTVYYSLGGTAQNGVDYQTLSGSVTIPAGSNTATVAVRPLGLLNALKTVVLTVSPNSGYTVGSPSTATVDIVVSLAL